MARRYLCSPLPSPGTATLDGGIAQHLRVMRVRPGETIRLFDGDDHEADATLRELGKGGVRVEVGKAEAVRREPRVAVELAIAIPKGARAEWLFEHGTEVGVVRFRPLVVLRSQGAARENRRERWLRVVRAACEQCDRSRVPAVDAEIGLADLLLDPSLPAERYLASPGAEHALGPARCGSVLLVVGPEGGFDEAESASLRAAGCEPRSLGELTLRTETAALVGAARLLA